MVTEQTIRQYFRDYPSENMKLLSEYFTPEEIALALDFARQKVDSSPPFVRTVRSSSVPDYIMMQGVCVQLLQIKINNLTINYTSGVTEHGVQLSIGEELSVLRALKEDFKRDFESELYNYKKAKDFRGATATIKSPYGSGGCSGGYY